MNNVLFSSKSDCWETPQYVFDELDSEFQFDLDVCADSSNFKCPLFFDKTLNGLIQDWHGHTCWCNPPYGRSIGLWVEKAYESWLYGGSTVVMLLPARTDTKWFHRFIYNKAEIRFIEGRLKFGSSNKDAPFPSMIVVFDRHRL